MRSLRLVWLLAALMVAGCAAQPAAPSSPTAPTSAARQGSAAPERPSVDPARLAARDVFGDLTKVDLCDYLVADDLKSFGTVTMAKPWGFDSCVYEVSPEADKSWLVDVGPFHVPSKLDDRGKSTDLGGGVQLVEWGSNEERCSQLLKFPDDVALWVDAGVSDGAPASDFCALTEAAAKAIVARFDDGITSRRSFRDNTLVSLKACELLPAEAPGLVPGLARTTEDESPGGHICSVGSLFATVPMVMLELNAGAAPVAYEGQTRESIANRTTVVMSEPEKVDTAGREPLMYCTAATEQVPTYIKGVQDTFEFAQVTVRVRAVDAAGACPAAKAIAEKVWAKLPPL